jgi:nucleoside 2-deoxyribosyltransferase
MAFGRTRDVWRFGIQRPLQEIVLCERMDETAFTGDILSEIKKRIARADIVIADITGANPNVFLEIGYAWAAETPTVLICRKATDGGIPPFDVRGQRYIEYEDITDLEDKLTKEVQALLPISRHKRRAT